jgi:hypothetical protein
MIHHIQEDTYLTYGVRGAKSVTEVQHRVAAFRAVVIVYI